MKIAFNPSTVAALTSPPDNKDITFDLRGQNIFARGVKFYGTDTNTWRDIKVNNVSIGSHTLDLRNGSNTTLTNTNGVVTINSTWRPVVDNLTSNSATSSLSANQGRVLAGLINGKSDSDHNHDDRYLKLTGGVLKGQIILPDIDVNTSYTGSIIIGASNAENLGIDGNEIMARTNGEASTLFLNKKGGAVELGAILRTNCNIAYLGSRCIQDMIKFIDNTDDPYGNGIAIGGGGLTIIGSGESSDVVMGQHSSGGDENMIIAGAGNIDFYSNLLEGWEQGKHMYLDTNGFLFTPSYINIGGNENNNSSPDRVWGSNSSDSYLRSYRTSALKVAYASTAGNAETLGGMPKNYGQAPFGTIPCIEGDGVMEIGRYIDYHYDNSGKYDYSTRLQVTGTYANVVNLPSASGTIPCIGVNSVMEIGRYIDYQYDNSGKYDYSTRLQATGNHKNVVSLPSASGTLALISQVLTWKSQIIDMRNYSESYWHPVTVPLPSTGYNKIKVSVQLNSGDKPSWATHNNGITCNMEIWATASGWGTTDSETICLNYTYNYCSQNPCGWMQLGYSSLGVVFLRGGSRYTVYTDFDAIFTPHNQKYTWVSGSDSQDTGGPYTSCPGLNFNIGAIRADLIATRVQARRVCAGHDPGIDDSISCSNWFRSSGNTGWYNTTYKGGWYMSDTSWIRAHNNVGIYTSGQIYSDSSIRMGNILLEHTEEINNITNGSIHLNYRNSGNISLCKGGGNVGIGTVSPTYKLDVNGQMRTSGFHHSSVDSNNYILLAGGGYKSFGGAIRNPIFLGYLDLFHGNDGTISSSFLCLGYSVPFTYTRGGSYCSINIPDTEHQIFYIKAATASVNYSGGGMNSWTGNHRGSGAWWLHCYAASSNEVMVKGFCLKNESNDSWWGGNPLWSGNDGANVITVCIFGHVTLR